MKTVAEYDQLKVPTWALSYLVNGGSSGISESDVSQVDKWFSQFTDAARDLTAKYGDVTVNFVCGDGEGSFTRRPEFGLACDCIECSVLLLTSEKADALERAKERYPNDGEIQTCPPYAC